MTRKQQHDVAIIGAGPGGYVAAIEAAREGKSVALIEKNGLGGTCLNVGCIPTKTLLASASVLHTIEKAQSFGISTGKIGIDFPKMIQRKDQVVEGIQKSLASLLASNAISIYEGKGEFLSPTSIKVRGKDSLLVEAPYTILATGSVPLDIPAFPCDHKMILNSTSLLAKKELPRHLVVIGGGYIGCEFASFFAALKVPVTIVEALPQILFPQGKEVGQFLQSVFEKQGISIRTNTKVTKIEVEQGIATLFLEEGSTLQADTVLVAVGRKPYVEGLCLEKVGLSCNAKGFLDVDDSMRTAVSNIFAIGDVTGKGMLAHVASHQGIVAAQTILGKEATMHYDAVPAVIFTHPEIALVGMQEEEAKKRGYRPIVGKIPFQAIGKAVAAQETEGFIQVVADADTNQILGALAVGSDSSNLIATMTLAIHNEIPLECVVDTIHAHPTLAESWHEAAALLLGAPIHLPPKRRR